MGSNSKTVVWFRRDLRIEDNPALAAAARDGCVFPVYIWCPKEEGQFFPGRVSRWWLKQSLVHLDQSLRSLGVELTLIKAESTVDALVECVKAIGASKVVFNRLYDPISLVRDHQIKQKLGDLNISVLSYNGDLLYEPWEVYDNNGDAFTTFAPFWDKCLNMHMEPASLPTPWRLVPASGPIKKFSIDELGLENDSEKSSNALLGRAWSPGWTNANKALIEFVEQHLIEYSKNRVKVGGNSTSLLSPYLHFGELSVRKVFHSVQMKQMSWANEGNSVGLESVNMFLRGLGFREYSRYLCFNFPFTHERSLLNHLKYFPWNPDQAVFKAWRQGRTGYPLVDAGMRELWATGWMHNRMRVIVSSFCVKFLLLPWRWGMKYFWDTLLDADLECDILGWQYISGSLPDGHDLNRLDDPELQGSKYDPEGDYVRQWLPELARMPTEWIHHPWDAPNLVLKAAGVELGSNYPKPIIDMDTARQRLTEAICQMQGMAGIALAETNGAHEVVVDNTENTGNNTTLNTGAKNPNIRVDNVEYSAIPKAVLNTNANNPNTRVDNVGYSTIPKAVLNTDANNPNIRVDNVEYSAIPTAVLNTNGNNPNIRVDEVENSAIPKAVPGCVSGSSRDQQVPSLQKPGNFLTKNGKRPRIPEEDRIPEEQNMDGPRTDHQEEEYSSTADSSPAKKPTTSMNSFCVPQACSVSSHSKGLLDTESSDVKQPWKEHRDIE